MTGITQNTNDYLRTSDTGAHEYFIGNCWEVLNIDKLANIVAHIAKGQILHAQNIISGINSGEQVSYLDEENLTTIKNECVNLLTVEKDASGRELRSAKKWQRDGFLFEAISWIATCQNAPSGALIRDPHVKPTEQGLDGLMIIIEQETNSPINLTIFEDKCGEDPRRMFREQILPYFEGIHRGIGDKSRQILANVTTLLRRLPIENMQKASIAGRVLDINIRVYRASLVINESDNNDDTRSRIFPGYDRLDNIPQANRLAATFVTSCDMRDWFEDFAQLVINKL